APTRISTRWPRNTSGRTSIRFASLAKSASATKSSPSPHREWAEAARSTLHQQRDQCVRIGQHRVVAAVELEVFAVEFFGDAALMRLGRVGAAPTADHRRGPALAPKALQLHRRVHGGDGMRRIAGE